MFKLTEVLADHMILAMFAGFTIVILRVLISKLKLKPKYHSVTNYYFKMAVLYSLYISADSLVYRGLWPNSMWKGSQTRYIIWYYTYKNTSL